MSGRMHQLYRCFDEHGRLLYVGISINAVTRAGQHRYTSPWWEHVRRIDITNVSASRFEAERAELAAIAKEHPLYNIVGTGVARQAKRVSSQRWDPAPLVARSCLPKIDLARRLGIDAAILDEPLTEERADELCTRMRFHPVEIWGTVWLEAVAL